MMLLPEVPVRRLLVFLLLQSLRSLILSPDQGEAVVALESFQSSVCSPVDERLHRQCFSEIPADRYEVLEGSPVRMRCRVLRQRGKAQWRAHNTLLGYDREIRNWPKYSMQGDADRGEHDLVISSVSRDDAGNFECQISPAANQPLLRRNTNLSVLVVPTKPIIMAPPGEPQPTKNGQLVISRPGISSESHVSDPANADDRLRLVCQAKGGAPAPTFEWFHNGLPVRASYVKGGGNELSSFEGGDGRTGESEGQALLVVPKADLITGDRLTCLVSNKATQRAANLGQQKLLAEIIVTVQTPPGAPVILSSDGNIIDTVIANEGDTLNLVCQSKPLGSPPGELIWRWDQPSSTFQTDSSTPPIYPLTTATELNKMFSLDQFSRHTSDKNQLESHLSLPGVKRAQNGLSVICVTRHKLGMEQKAKILLYVKYPFSSVCIHKSDMGNARPFTSDSSENQKCSVKSSASISSSSSSLPNVLYVHPERQQIFSCSTTPFYGQATIKWFGALTASDTEWHDLTNLTSIAELKRGGPNGASYIKTVSLRLPPTYLGRLGALQCRGYPSANVDSSTHTDIVDQVVLKAYEAPQRPTIHVGSMREGLEEGDILKLKCEAVDGVPEGKISWLKATRENPEYEPIYLISTTEHDKLRLRIVSNLDIQLTSDDHLSSFKCASSNPGFPVSEAQTSAAFHVNLTFRPQHIRIDRLTEVNGIPQEDPIEEPPKVITVTAGELLTLLCTAGPANPPVPLQWRQILCDMYFGGNHSTNFGVTDSETNKASCKVINSFGDARALPLLPSKIVSRNQVSMLVQAHHHQSRVECSTLEAEKSPVRPNWRVQGPEEETRLKKDITLNVLFKPNFANVLSKLNSSTSKYLPQYITIEGASLDLDLAPVSNPPITTARWFHGKFDPQTLSPWVEITELVSIEAGAPARLRLQRVGIEHMGNYKLVGVNSIGSADLVFFLNVTHAPRLVGEPLINVTTKGEQAELLCRVKANPPPLATSVHWRRVMDEAPAGDATSSISDHANTSSGTTPSSRNDEKLSIAGLRCNQEFVASRAKYYVKCFSPEPYHLVSTLYVTDVDPSDVGRYECFVDNGIGSPVVRFIDLIYPFTPRVLQIPRWSRAAPPYDPPDMGLNRTHIIPLAPVPPTTVVCVIAAEPAPTVTWFREPTNLTLIEGGQFKSYVTRLHAGRYRALLTIEFVRQVDFGSYYCQARNNMGTHVGKVILGPTSPPSRPGNPFLIRTTSSSLTIGWLQAFSGGPSQTYIVKWTPDDEPDSVQIAEVKEDFMSEVINYTIENLSKATRYRIYVAAKNPLHKASPFTDHLIATTDAFTNPMEVAMRDEAQGGSGAASSATDKRPGAEQMTGDSAIAREDNNGSGSSSLSVSMIVTIATCFGCLIFITNLIIVGLVLHRRHQRKNSRLKRIPGAESLVKCGVMEGYPTSDCYPDRFLNGQHVFGHFMDSASQKDSLSQYQFEHFGQCSPQIPAEYISSTGSYFPRDSPLNLFSNSPALIAASEQHTAALHHHARQQHRLNSQTLSRSSSPLHSSRSHGLQPPATPSSLEHARQLITPQRHPSFITHASGGIYPPDQSIYLVAAPNPHHYMMDDPLNAAAAAAALYGGLPQGTMSPYSLTDKSVGGISDGRGGTNGCGAGSSIYGGSGGRAAMPTGATTLGYQSSPRMITSFYSPSRPEVNVGSSNALGPHMQNSLSQVPRRIPSFATPNRVYPIENTTLGRNSKCAGVNFTSDVSQQHIMQMTDMDTMNAVGTANDLTMSSDLVATIPPPTDFNLPPPTVARISEINGTVQYPASGSSPLLRQPSPLSHSGEPGVDWSKSPSHQLPMNLVRSSTSPQKTAGVHFDLKM